MNKKSTCVVFISCGFAIGTTASASLSQQMQADRNVFKMHHKDLLVVQSKDLKLEPNWIISRIVSQDVSMLPHCTQNRIGNWEATPTRGIQCPVGQPRERFT